MDTVRNGAVDKCLVYGINGCGKSNLGLAIFDLVLHLTDKETTLMKYVPYRNLDNKEKAASFSYTFQFEGHDLEYWYQKESAENLLNEQVTIDGKVVLVYDYLKGIGAVELEGTEKLNLVSMDRRMSFVKYVSRNSILTDTVENHVFQQFIDFVDHMLLFYSLSERYYQGFKVGRESIGKGIIERGKVKDFEKFLQDSGVDLNLTVREFDDEKQLMV